MIDREHELPITRQAEALNISRGSVYYLPRPVPDIDPKRSSAMPDSGSTYCYKR